MILSINMHDERLVCLETTNIRTVSIVNNCINVTMNSRFGIDDLKIYADTADECQYIYDRIVYCVNHPISALNSAKDYLAIGCKETKSEKSEREKYLSTERVEEVKVIPHED
jgi:hypothetical protein